jgi:hypothetical protein
VQFALDKLTVRAVAGHVCFLSFSESLVASYRPAKLYGRMVWSL